MVIQNDPSARMQLRSQGELSSPASCIVCGNGSCDEGYIDFQIFVDYHGTLYLCHTCITQAGETAGMYTPDEVESQQQLIKKLTEDNALLKETLDHVKPVYDSVMRSAASSGARIADYVVYDPASESEASDGGPETSNNESEPAVTESDAGEPEPAKSVKGSGRSNSRGTKPRHITF